jgi:hypothetical protein
MNKAKIHWKNVFGESWRDPGNIRWWAMFELYSYLDDQFDDLIRWVTTSADNGDMDAGVRIRRLRLCIETLPRRRILKLETRVICIIFRPLIQTTYILEGDSCTAVVAYDAIAALHDWLQEHTCNLSFPGIDDALEECAAIGELPMNQTLDQFKATLLNMVAPIAQKCLQYFENTIINKLSADLQIFKACRYVNPMAFRMFGNVNVQIFKNDIRQAFEGRVTDRQIDAMVEEIPRYRAAIRTRVFSDIEEVRCLGFGTYYNYCRSTLHTFIFFI